MTSGETSSGASIMEHSYAIATANPGMPTAGAAMSIWAWWPLLICARSLCTIVGVASLARQEQGNRHRIVRDLL